jgi:aminoglycoside phosphotransferase (APT) family kinase protein
MTSAAPDPARLAAAVARRVREPVEIEGLRRLSGGASRESWSFDALTGAGVRHGLVLRRDPGGYAGHSDRSIEYSVLRAVHAAGVAVPEVWFLLGPDDELGSGFVMARVDGETIPRKILRDKAYASARPRMAAQCGELAARIHGIDTSALPDLPARGAGEQIVQYREYLDGFGEPHPAFELGLRWLEENTPPPHEPVLVHGDFRHGNFVVGAEGIRAVLDWELAHLGDPVEDLGWLCVKSWRFGMNHRSVGGFGDVDDLLGAYRDAGGGDVDRDAVRYWETFGTLKWGVMCEIQAFTHLQGMVRSVELATLGRRVAEMEWDLLESIDPTGEVHA